MLHVFLYIFFFLWASDETGQYATVVDTIRPMAVVTPVVNSGPRDHALVAPPLKLMAGRRAGRA